MCNFYTLDFGSLLFKIEYCGPQGSTKGVIMDTAAEKLLTLKKLFLGFLNSLSGNDLGCMSRLSRLCLEGNPELKENKVKCCKLLRDLQKPVSCDHF